MKQEILTKLEKAINGTFKSLEGDLIEIFDHQTLYHLCRESIKNMIEAPISFSHQDIDFKYHLKKTICEQVATKYVEENYPSLIKEIDFDALSKMIHLKIAENASKQ